MLQCVLCERIFTSKRLFSLKRHFNNFHEEVASLSQTEKLALFEQKKKDLFSDGEVSQDNSAITSREIKKASFVVALFLAKHYRPYEDGDFFKSLAKEFFASFEREGERICEIVESVPLSRQTITRRTEKISAFVLLKLKQLLEDCEYFSLSLDESTDINNIGQLIFFVKVVNKNFETSEHLLSIVPLHGHINGQTIFDAVNEHVFSICSPNKLSSICTDGAKNMTGRDTGLVGRLRRNNINAPAFQCIIHQQALFSKELNKIQAMNTAVRVINKIKGGHHALTHRQFKEFLEELGTDHGDLCMYTEVRWLSRGKSLERFYNLREEVEWFLEQNNETELADKIKSIDFISELAFLCDVTLFINELNLAMQGQNKNIFDLLLCINQCERNLAILVPQLKNGDCSGLLRTTAAFDQIQNQNFRIKKTKELSEVTESLLRNLQRRFQDFKVLQNIISIHNDPINCDISQLSPSVRDEVHRMRLDFNLPLGSGQVFWKNISEEKYPNIRNEILKLYSMFGSTYNCEAAFSKMKLIQTKYRNSISDSHLRDLMLIKSYDKEIDIDSLL